ncbi:redox-sensitive bicupin YhaK (pirin superfamily) [Microlunatus panaciterrae]|uniref:Redox-sensitive bicupin YhaK (Pirin superfamily) n=1 Tax=Microlunatus panaciterrae TaxID=400768 RepID=A0ABS2RF54_9ACTN|nr:redox-sensitive bicupin YhaK (pirin superfamily) [Microlunatus panaciterrae]
MSDLDTRPTEQECHSCGAAGPEELLLSARKVWLGKTTEVRRALPDREIRMIGAWCFLDHYGPEDVSSSPGMQVWPHPHTGLQTVSWLFEGEIEHRDGLGSQAMVRPGELNIMTAGRGIVHSEMSLPDKPPTMHGVQLWVALPAADRQMAPQFTSYHDLPDLTRPGVAGKVLLGELDGVRSPAAGQTPLTGADLSVAAGAEVALQVDREWEYGLFVAGGVLQVESTTAGTDQLVYLGTGRQTVRLASVDGARVVLLGGLPFAEDIVMWWNFIGRSHDEIVEYREAWLRRDARFAPVVSPDEKVMEAPPLPTVTLKPRQRRHHPDDRGPH